jgi:8-oxo-dGTP pyrophosphatase MutT (NUDIX family)
MSEPYCNNCGKQGHLYNNCKVPITSYGVIAFRYNKDKIPEYLMIRRKDTLGYIDFLRGKYFIQNKEYLVNMFKQMTIQEKENLKNNDFDTLWKNLWKGSIQTKYKNEELISKDKFNMLVTGVVIKNDFYTLNSLIDTSNLYETWSEPEWGFPKGRRNYQENDYDCALREFTEETGYNSSILKNIQNILPLEEIFIGSNYKSYKHKYFLMYVSYKDSTEISHYEESEVSKIEWKSYEDCIKDIRSYNLEKKKIITNIYNSLKKCRLYL